MVRLTRTCLSAVMSGADMSILTRFAQKVSPSASSGHTIGQRSGLLNLVLFLILVVALLLLYHLLQFNSDGEHTIYRPLLVDNLVDLPLRVLDADYPDVDDTNVSCNYFGCFNVYRCGSRGNRLLVYVYPPEVYVDATNKPITGPVSREFYRIVEAITSSQFYTPNPREACIFVPSIDTLNQNKIKVQQVSQILKTLPFWNKGENHLIFNMIPGSAPDFNAMFDGSVGKAMIAGASFSTFTYRRGFDISIPVYSPIVENLKTNVTRTRSRLVMASQINLNIGFEQDLIELKTKYPKDILLLGPCLNHSPLEVTVRCLGQDVYKYPNVLQTATFCLVIRGARLGQSVLLESMAAGCIPVIIADSLVMPFGEIIDWKRAAIFVREVDILNVIPRLKKVSQQRIKELQNQVIWLYNKYFKNIQKIALTALEILSDRVFPHIVRNYNDWNVPPQSIIQSPLFLPATASKMRGFTAVILTYDRIELLYTLINKLVKVPSLSKVLVIWNNQNKDPPPSSEWPKVNKPLKVLQTKENKLSNRFYPYDEIETEAILSIDDDIIMLTVDEVEFAFEVWREFPDRIVGFPSRTHTWDNETLMWKYESEWTNLVSMVLTGAAFYHKYWSYMYTTAMPGDIKEWVDEHMNCEDIAMNFLVSNMTGKAPIKVTPKKKFRCPECTNTEMLSADLTHMAERTQCINRFSEIFGRMPLKSVEFRADPVLFKDAFPEKLKRFNDIGSL